MVDRSSNTESLINASAQGLQMTNRLRIGEAKNTGPPKLNGVQDAHAGIASERWFRAEENSGGKIPFVPGGSVARVVGPQHQQHSEDSPDVRETASSTARGCDRERAHRALFSAQMEQFAARQVFWEPHRSRDSHDFTSLSRPRADTTHRQARGERRDSAFRT